MTTRPVSPLFSGSSALDLFLDPFAPQVTADGKRPQVEWRFVLCDLYGFQISVINSLMLDTSMTFLLNRPSSLTFAVPSDDPHFNTLYYDEFPFLSCGNRIIKGYRRTELDDKWTLRYVGRIWNLTDSGDGNVVQTTVTCYDSLQELSARIVRGSTGSFHKTVKFWGHGTTTPGNKYSYGTAIKAMIDRTNQYGAAPTTIKTTGYWDPAIFGGDDNPTSGKLALLAFNQAKILPSMITITDTALMDLEVTYIDANGDTTKDPVIPAYHMRLGASVQVGSLGQVEAIFGYAAAPKNTASMTRTQDMSTFANDVTLYGASNRGRISHHVDSGSGLSTYGAFEDVIVESSIHTKQLLDDLAKEILALRKKPRELVNFVPLPELAPLPWDNWNLGDTITVYLGVPKSTTRTDPYNPLTRESRMGKQRVYGFTIGIEENYSEHVTAMILSADAEPS